MILRLKPKGELVGDHQVFRKKWDDEEFEQAEMSLLLTSLLTLLLTLNVKSFQKHLILL